MSSLWRKWSCLCTEDLCSLVCLQWFKTNFRENQRDNGTGWWEEIKALVQRGKTQSARTRSLIKMCVFLYVSLVLPSGIKWHTVGAHCTAQGEPEAKHWQVSMYLWRLLKEINRFVLERTTIISSISMGFDDISMRETKNVSSVDSILCLAHILQAIHSDHRWFEGWERKLKKKIKRWRETGKEIRGTISSKLTALFTVVISRIIITTVHTTQGGDYTRPLNHFGLYFNASSTQASLNSMHWINKTHRKGKTSGRGMN